ncbi:hypothetical protein PoB_006114500 [Plakobranchus ocellatus]|uniref:Uncharacterized protein n=1 Tax=Plakobranchus ocellatus TaxID=259542 RepID=A0AAV4CS22_9GAST|nr:hypothetical protein PoB_006114500 [Plakobranchus ocellatus]
MEEQEKKRGRETQEEKKEVEEEDVGLDEERRGGKKEVEANGNWESNHQVCSKTYPQNIMQDSCVCLDLVTVQLGTYVVFCSRRS